MADSLTPAEFMDLIVKNDEPAVARALTRGFNPNFQIEHITPIISASKRQCNGIELGGADINESDRKGWTPMHWAAALGNFELVTMLLGWGADFDKETPSRKTPVDLAYIKNDENPGCQRVIDILNAHVSGTSLRTRSMTSAARAAVSPAVLGGGYLPTPYDLYTMGLMDYGAGPGPGRESKARSKTPRPRHPVGQRVCAECQTADTPQWRRGPTGMGTLCNACGLKFIHMHHRDKKNARRRELYMLQKVAKPRQPSS